MKYSSLKDIVETGVSHNPEIKKKVLIANGQVPHLTQLAKTILAAGQVAGSHIHQDMYEIFLAENGTGEIIVNDNKYSLIPGACVTIDPGEKHEITNTGKNDLVLTIIGMNLHG
ncbi:cupin [Candidatus Daviesbacteria bacterium RIFCSPLOWO2_02_FULL_41_8]|uniref:Cupin n=2 Tax=Candidatus Daviesiibacteriota TaxID=1752718 RepID=A0A1F5NLT7_9BACT|nr:MAG: cupin [Candidatus Daviesbacteria bacterium RIFCSPHIGHO2_01_FULL_41_23]OGE62213.1 MAG: cupin [Candidatus Daviesbacteria bacterium RIFCSPLOWO2_01_FULL_41_32]OGE78588.1 MAG: cupin [Candidatus Daviesbacteria bacterium RIFCSPLOWO2_02_FULL_41_8]